MGLSSNEAFSRDEPTAALALTRSASQGDEAARRALVDRLFDRVRRTSSYVARNRADAEDLAQAALVRILGCAGSFKGESSLERWADRVTILTAAKEFEKKTRRSRLFAAKWAPQEEGDGLEEDAEARRIRALLIAAFGKLSAPNRAAMSLHYFHGYGVAEVAELVDAPLNTVRGRLRAGREQLKKIIAADPALKEWFLERTS